jgi:GH18 family chitinase
MRVIVCVVSLCLVADAAAGEFRIAGYLPEYRVDEFDAEALAGLTDLLVFSAEPTAEGGLDLARLKNVPWEKLHDFKSERGVRLTLCVGGWGRWGGFASVAQSAEKRRAFAAACVRICRERRLDGVDLDWEFPQGEAQQQDYAELLRELHQAFQPEKLTLSVTVAGHQQLPAAAIKAVDWVQIMAYDHDGRHSTYDDAVGDVELRLKRDVPREKIVLGVPFYGRHTKRRSQSLTYREILAKYKPAAEDDEVSGYYFNGPATIDRKTDYALREKLGGVMIWELGQDARGENSLLKVIRQRVVAHRDE